MIRIPICGIKIFFVVITFISCKVDHKLIKENSVDYSIYTTYKNRTIDNRLTYFGDYIFEKFEKRKLLSYGDSIVFNLWKNRITHLYYTRTTVDPFYELFCLVLPKKAGESIFSDKIVSRISDVVVKHRLQKIWISRKEKYDLYYIVFSDINKNLVDDSFLDRFSLSMNEEIEKILSTESRYKEDDDQLIDPFSYSFKILNANGERNYMEVITKLNKIEHQFEHDKFLHSLYYQCQSTYSTFLGSDSLLTKYSSKLFNSSLNNLDQNYVEMNKIESDEIFEDIILKEQVLMFNESHIDPSHRLIIADLLPRFKEAGYKYIALEALTESGRDINRRGYPNRKSGFYFEENQMANLIRKAINLGFNIVNYESDRANRELGQAENLYKKTLKKDANAKIVALAGGGHIDEYVGEDGKIMMAHYFKKISGVDPYTINQTYFAKELAKKGTITYLEGNSDKLKHDLYIINNLDYIESASFKDSYTIANLNLHAFLNVSDYFGVYLYPKHETHNINDAVPCYSYYGSKKDLSVKIPSGEYVIKIHTENSSKYLNLTIDSTGLASVR